MSDAAIDEAIRILEAEQMNSELPPAIVVMPPDTGEFIHGNRGGLVRLAIAALQAAKGEDQSFEKQPWVVDNDYDWGVQGFKYDALSHMELPPKRPKCWARVRAELAGYVTLLVLLTPFTVGLITMGTWAGNLINSLVTRHH
jgi:hypothetical protein